MMLSDKHYTNNTWSKFVLLKQGYDPFIDYLKGLCIIFVILNHCMPEIIMKNTGFFFWGVSAVPIFIIIQVFHAYKRGVDDTQLKINRIIRKIIWPFVLAEFFILVAYIIRDNHLTYKDIINDIFCLIRSGGYGPGAYYPFIYLQFAIILPIIACVFKTHKPFLCFVFILISQLLETVCSYFHLPQLAYRLLFFRYFFLFYLGYLLAYKGYILNLFTFLGALICLVFSTYIVYFQHSLSPFLYDFVNPVCHWFSYIYIAFLLMFILKTTYYYLDSNTILIQFIIKAGKYSYDIFILQIIYFAVINDYINNLIKHLTINNAIYIIIGIILPVLTCTIPVILIKEKIYAIKIHKS